MNTSAASTEKQEVPPSEPAEEHSRSESEGALSSALGWLKSALKPRKDTSLRSVIEEVIEEHGEELEHSAAITPEEKVMLRNLLAFGELTVLDVMVPRTDIIAIEQDMNLEELKATIREKGHTRMPVYKETLDDVTGFVHIKDIFGVIEQPESFQLEKIVRQILVVPPSMKVADLLARMRLSGVHMAIVVDEYGGTDGLVTLEDLCEQIIGDIQDEHDEEEASEIVWLSDQMAEMDARRLVEALERDFAVKILEEQEEEDFDTVGGMIFSQLGRVPARGEKIQHPSGLVFEVLDADDRRIKRVRVTKPEIAEPVAG